MDYERDTKQGYLDKLRAEKYKQHLTKNITWTRLAMWRERVCVEKALKQCQLTTDEKVIDSPCGTGIMGSVLNKFPASIIAYDISREMMSLALDEYDDKKLYNFLQGDITMTPFKKNTFSCVLCIGFIHRLPANIRVETIRELGTISSRYIILSCTVDSPTQRLKQKFLKITKPSHQSAPSPVTLAQIKKEFGQNNLTVKRMFRVATFLSAEVLFLLEKRQTQ